MLNENEQRELHKQLRERIKQLRIDKLFEEPCSLYDEDDDYFIGENIWIILYYYVFHP